MFNYAIFKLENIMRAVKADKYVLAEKLCQSCYTIEKMKEYIDKVEQCEVFIYVKCKPAIIEIINETIAEIMKKELIINRILSVNDNSDLVILPQDIVAKIVSMA